MAGALGEGHREARRSDPDQGVRSSCGGRRRVGGQGQTANPDAEDGSQEPIGTAHRNSATVGVPTVGRFGTASEKVPKPVRLSRPTKISEPMPAASRPGNQDHAQHGAADPGDLHQEKRAGSGDPNIVLIAAKLPAAPITA